MLKLYHNNISVCAQKVRIVLAEKNLPTTLATRSHVLSPRMLRITEGPEIGSAVHPWLHSLDGNADDAAGHRTNGPESGVAACGCYRD
jgi:hypothetical protein